MAAETSWHRYGTKLRHCHPMYYRYDMYTDRRCRTKIQLSSSTVSVFNNHVHIVVSFVQSRLVLAQIVEIARMSKEGYSCYVTAKTMRLNDKGVNR